MKCLGYGKGVKNDVFEVMSKTSGFNGYEGKGYKWRYLK